MGLGWEDEVCLPPGGVDAPGYKWEVCFGVDALGYRWEVCFGVDAPGYRWDVRFGVDACEGVD